jgi:hypothetical protein
MFNKLFTNKKLFLGLGFFFIFIILVNLFGVCEGFAKNNNPFMSSHIKKIDSLRTTSQSKSSSNSNSSSTSNSTSNSTSHSTSNSNSNSSLPPFSTLFQYKSQYSHPKPNVFGSSNIRALVRPRTN